MLSAEEIIRETARRKINYTTLADRAGVSRSMLSMAIHGHRRFSEKTEKYIRKVLKNLPLKA